MFQFLLLRCTCSTTYWTSISGSQLAASCVCGEKCVCEKAKVLTRLHGCAVSPEPSLFACMLSHRLHVVVLVIFARIDFSTTYVSLNFKFKFFIFSAFMLSKGPVLTSFDPHKKKVYKHITENITTNFARIRIQLQYCVRT